MTLGTVKSQGTELYFVNTVPTDPAVVKLSCPTGMTGLGGAADQLDTTCLDSIEKEFARGLGNPGQVSVPFNFIPSNASHQTLIDLKDDGRSIQWFIGFSDGTTAPTLSGTDFVVPTSPLRTSAVFTGYISDVNIDIATNDIVKGTLTIQRSGAVTWHWNGPTPT